MFPQEPDPKGGKWRHISQSIGTEIQILMTCLIDPETWSEEDMKRWLNKVCRL